MPVAARKQGGAGPVELVAQIASRGYGGGAPAGAGPTARGSIYRLIMRPALAEIVGDGRPWTALMISLLSMP
jgi:hypothetical protein